MDNVHKKSRLQVIGSAFVIITGIFVIFSVGNSITGNVVGQTNLPYMQIVIALWGILTIIAGLWMIKNKNFHKSIFD